MSIFVIFKICLLFLVYWICFLVLCKLILIIFNLAKLLNLCDCWSHLDTWTLKFGLPSIWLFMQNLWVWGISTRHVFYPFYFKLIRYLIFLFFLILSHLFMRKEILVGLIKLGNKIGRCRKLSKEQTKIWQ